MVTTPLVMVATPCFGGVVAQRYMLSVLDLIARGPRAGFGVALSLLGYDSLIPRGRATLVGCFLDNPDATHLLFIDADIGFEPAQVERMLRFDKDFVGALYPIKAIDWARVPERCTLGGEPLERAGLNYVGTFEGADKRQSQDGFATAIYAGGGFQLLRRSMIERMIAGYPETKFAKLHGFPREASHPSPNLYALFDCQIDPETGVYLSEDYSFCRRWRALGGEIWLDTTSRLIHVGSTDYVGDFATRAYTLEQG